MDDDLYGILEVSRSASDNEIRKAYHKQAKLYHPDKNPGDEGEEKFKKIQMAYEILSDSQKRTLYDRYGMEAFKDGGAGGSSMFDGFPGMFFGGDSGGGGSDMFSSFFGGGLFGGHQRRRTVEPTVIPLEVTLEDLYTGTTKTVEYKKKSLCSQCRGTGSKSGQSTTCRACRGSGIKVIHKPIGPNMVQQMRAECSDCDGTGDFVRIKDRCTKCKGQRIFDKETKLDVPITAGMQHNQKIPFRQQGDESPDTESGDLIVVLQEMDHATFNRDGLDLIMEKEISIVEALCGFTFVVDHLDGRKLAVQNKPNQIISPNTVRGLEGEGMPHQRHVGLKGNLYIKFDVIFPDKLDESSDKFFNKLERVLPPKSPNPLEINDDAEDVTLHNYEDTKGSGNFSGNTYEDDDERGPHGHPGGVSCQQQ